MIHPRICADRLRKLLRQFPIVTILGARQTGKSTLARHAFPTFEYLDLEDPNTYALFERDIGLVLSSSSRLVLDEAQRFPPLFPALRSFIDRHPRHRVLLLGSASPRLNRHLSESLTGRVGLFELAGLSVQEEDWQSVWLKGGFPRVHWGRPRADPREWYPAYLKSHLEQDLPQLGVRVSALKFHRLLTMVAHTQGGICNLSELGGSLGMDYHTVSHLLDILEGTFLVRRLPPYFANIGKRLVKNPKVFIRDTGILHSLLGIAPTRKSLLSHPKAGASFETFCMEQIVQHARLHDPAAEPFFYRTHTGTEIDLLLRFRGKLIPIEFKMSTTADRLKGLGAGMRDLDLKQGYFVNLTERSRDIGGGIHMCNLLDLLRVLKVGRTK